MQTRYERMQGRTAGGEEIFREDSSSGSRFYIFANNEFLVWNDGPGGGVRGGEKEAREERAIEAALTEIRRSSGV